MTRSRTANASARQAQVALPKGNIRQRAAHNGKDLLQADLDRVIDQPDPGFVFGQRTEQSVTTQTENPPTDGAE